MAYKDQAHHSRTRGFGDIEWYYVEWCHSKWRGQTLWAFQSCLESFDIVDCWLKESFGMLDSELYNDGIYNSQYRSYDVGVDGNLVSGRCIQK
jgi:hypothetical protein